MKGQPAYRAPLNKEKKEEKQFLEKDQTQKAARAKCYSGARTKIYSAILATREDQVG